MGDFLRFDILSTCLDASRNWVSTRSHSIHRVSERLGLETQETHQNGQNVHGFQVGTPVCHIAPVSRAYPYIRHQWCVKFLSAWEEEFYTPLELRLKSLQ